MEASRGATVQPPLGGIDPEECTREFMPLVRRMAHSMQCRLLAAVSELSKRERRMLKLRLNGSLELRRIAVLFSMTESRVCQLLSEAAARVRARLRQSGG
jgi:RNA polymerase sigma factor FliA